MTGPSRDLRLDFGRVLNSEGALNAVSHDLLSLAQQAFLTDRAVTRGGTPDSTHWHRHLDLNVCVIDPHRWAQVDLTHAVIELLNWLSDDTWTVQWRPLTAPHPGPGQGQLFSDERPRSVILFSGGLDAVAGVAHHLPKQDLEAVAVYTNRVMQGYQRRTISALRHARLGCDLEFQQIDFSVQGGKRDSEPSRRSRGLVFLCLGAAMALRRGRNHFIMAENGIGAINLPLTRAQSGAMTSRSAHPRTLQLFERVLSLATQEVFEVKAPFLALTKAQVIDLLPESALAAVRASESCDLAAAGRGSMHRRCGFCSSCLLRRMAFNAAERASWDHPQYLADTHPHQDRSQRPEMLWQAAALDRALRDSAPGRLERDFPELADVPEDRLDRAAQKSLLSTFVDEWRKQPDPSIRRYLVDSPLEG